MPSATPSSTISLTCPHCGAQCDPFRERCWLCEAQIHPAVVGKPHHAETTAQTPPDRVGSYSLASLMMLVTLASVVLGVSTIAPGVGIPLGVVLLVVWIRTSLVARRRLAQGVTVSRAERTHLFLNSLGVSLGLIAVVYMAGFAALFAACFACVGTYAGLNFTGSNNFAFMVACIVCGLVALAISVPTLWWIARVIRSRWRRDTLQEPTAQPPPAASFQAAQKERMPVNIVAIMCVVSLTIAGLFVTLIVLSLFR